MFGFWDKLKVLEFIPTNTFTSYHVYQNFPLIKFSQESVYQFRLTRITCALSDFTMAAKKFLYSVYFSAEIA